MFPKIFSYPLKFVFGVQKVQSNLFFWKKIFETPKRGPWIFQGPILRSEKIVSDCGNIYTKRCEIKKLSHQKKAFEKILSTARVIAKKLAEKNQFAKSLFYKQFFGLN